MKGIPGTLQEGGAAFQSTHWSLVLRTAESQSPETAGAALTSFCQTYWPPLYTFLRRRGHASSDAQDLTQAFFVHLLEQKTLTRANREKGRLRTFLLGSLQHFLANERAHHAAHKRGGGRQIVSMDDQLIEAEASMLHDGQADAASGYDRQWAADLVTRAWDALYATLAAEGKRKLIDALKPFVIGGAGAPPDQADTAERLAMPISTFRNALRRLRLRYREAVREEVARTVADPEQVDEELQYLFRLLVS